MIVVEGPGSGDGDPLVAARTDSSPSSVHLAPADADFQWVQTLKPDAIVITGTGPEMHADLTQKISTSYRRVDAKFYRVRLKRGEEKWELFVKPNAPN